MDYLIGAAINVVAAVIYYRQAVVSCLTSEAMARVWMDYGIEHREFLNHVYRIASLPGKAWLKLILDLRITNYRQAFPTIWSRKDV